MPAHSGFKGRCPGCGGKIGFSEGGEVRSYEPPEDVDLGEKPDTDLPDYDLDGYRGENAKRKQATPPEDGEDESPEKRAEFAAALRRRRRAY